MKIYTKKGDSGKTSLLGGERVLKSHLRLKAYGAIDELNSHIGVLRSSLQDKNIKENLIEIQSALFNIGSHLACNKESLKNKLPLLKETFIEALEEQIDFMNKNLKPLSNFILPGGCMSASLAHQTRTICRRAERHVVVLLSEENLENLFFVKYLNRLSDYLFVLARFLNHLSNKEETLWIKN